MMNGLYTILLLIGSNIFMTLAWYGHLKLQQMNISNSWPLWLVIVFSWGIAFFEYLLQVPANKLGFVQWRSLLAGAVESDSGGRLPHRLYHHRLPHVPRRAPPLEPCRRLPLPCSSSIFRVLEMIGPF